MEEQNHNTEENNQDLSVDGEKISSMGKNEKLEELKRMALEEGLSKAVFLAKKIGDAYLLDELHDALANELKQRLKEEGKLEEL